MMQAQLPYVQSIAHGIHVIDTGFHRPMFDASFLMVENGRAAFIDTGTNHALPRLLATLAALGLAPEAVDYVIATHVHLDHAGGAGLLMQHLPGATLVVHPHGAQHLIDPSRLMASARTVYGVEEVARSYGEVVGVAPGRVLRTEDGMVITLAGRPLKFIDTPGHARHHHCIWDERSRGFFTGDTFGLSYREFDTEQVNAGPPHVDLIPSGGGRREASALGHNMMAWLLPTTTPVQFEQEPLRNSVQRMLAHEPQCMYLTHYGRVGDSAAEVRRLAALLLQQLDAMVALAQSLPDDADRHNALVRGFGSIYRSSLREHGCTLDAAQIDELLSLDCELNAQGMAVWLDRRKRSKL